MVSRSCICKTMNDARTKKQGPQWRPWLRVLSELTIYGLTNINALATTVNLVKNECLWAVFEVNSTIYDWRLNIYTVGNGVHSLVPAHLESWRVATYLCGTPLLVRISDMRTLDYEGLGQIESSRRCRITEVSYLIIRISPNISSCNGSRRPWKI